ncbi:hypothetical protein EN828_29825 [Mesorhizobium sp. M2D.F.Ca.ET.185.01.1.1]|nr:hypothetical protein EN783_27480 [Mesorhizobium sp. M2D.F.Ca.ET.140.01.1.1]TGP14029.1 hypothetical protein EN876_28990 [Mesorhizobium sp. M2D.F.Ca.ET.233.01.1.1]TGP29428.1 hypothetical protein EN875_028430 [Mesorhizobium sp. M2D.F.Ca.ET.232.01.1.1]TGP52448.1 hypothetical protein EN873_14270 [bacterium M00.F.Ca.ET.230.01.1.1]TGP53362.1 hypothetical protein EN869_030050 [Mesorhizobium sp. M2D.F.Ca.ET.226.01.1.1]TGP62104.1 hypothetical protein EN868_29785 [Mesorhizobium sp. M2D.F.Ca.ET.225.01.
MGWRGLASRETCLLPVTRLIIVFLMMGSFALMFAELVRHSEEMSQRPQPTTSRCGDATGTPCPQRAL